MMQLARRGQSNMFWIIIGAVLALVVLIILLLLFTSQTNDLKKGVSGCAGKGGECVAGTSCPSDTLEAPFTCTESIEICCIGFGNDEG